MKPYTVIEIEYNKLKSTVLSKIDTKIRMPLFWGTYYWAAEPISPNFIVIHGKDNIIKTLIKSGLT